MYFTKTWPAPLYFAGCERTIVRMDTHYHIWYYRRAPDGTIGSMERDHTTYPTRRKANYALSDGRKYWNAGQVLQCVDGAFCQPKPQEILDWGMPSPGRFTIADLADQAKSIRPAAKQVIAATELERRRAAGRIMSHDMAKERIKELWDKIQADSDEIERIRRRVAAGSEDE